MLAVKMSYLEIILNEYRKFLRAMRELESKLTKNEGKDFLDDFSQINKGFKRKICMAKSHRKSSCEKHAVAGDSVALSSARKEAVNAKNGACNSKAMSRLKLKGLITGASDSESTSAGLMILSSENGIRYVGGCPDKPDAVNPGYKYKGNRTLSKMQSSLERIIKTENS